MAEVGAPVITTSQAMASTTRTPPRLVDDYRKKLGELVELTDTQEKRLKAWLKKRIKEWRADTEDLHEQLKADNDLVEGVVMETDFPWEGASNVHVPVAEMYMEVYKCVEKRSILGADTLWEGETALDDLKDSLVDIEEMMNYKARHEWNIVECLSAVFWTTNRDGLGIIKCTWEEDYEKSRDILIFTNEDEFLQTFPNPEQAGIDENTYMDYWEQAITADDQFPLEVPVTFEKKKYVGCKGRVVEAVNFVIIPAWAPDIDHELCQGYGERYHTRGSVIRKKSANKFWYEDACKKVLSKKGKESSVSDYQQAQDEIEGLGRSNLTDNYELFEIVAMGRIDGETDDDGNPNEEEKFLLTYSDEHDELLQCIYYPYRVDFYSLFKINERPNRLYGRSIPTRVRDMNDEIDTQHNQRINTRTIGTVPSFKGQKSKKTDIDAELNESKWKPGRIFWLDDFNAFDQFKVQPTDLGESMNEEENDFKILDLYLGSAVSLLSGGAAAGDPSAPGNKTAMMIQQSNLRMDDPLSELRPGVSKLGNICLSHLYQFGPPIIEWQSEVGSAKGRTIQETKSIHKKYLRQGITMVMAGITVTQNAEAEMAKEAQIHGMLMQEPLYAQNAQLRIEGLRDVLRAGRISGRNRKLPSAQEIQQSEIQLRQQAMQQQQAQQAQAQQAQQQAMLKDRISKVRQGLAIKSLAQKVAERNLAEAGAKTADPSQLQPALNGAQPNGQTPA